MNPQPPARLITAARALADGFADLSGLFTALDQGLEECANALSQCEVALIGVSRGAALSPDVLRDQAAAAKAAQLLIAKLRATVGENRSGIQRALDGLTHPTSESMQR